MGVVGHVRRARLLDADPDDDEAAIAIALGKITEHRSLRLARWTPRCPEVEPDGLAPEIRELDRLAIEVGQRSR
jgi:hypothetical protein